MTKQLLTPTLNIKVVVAAFAAIAAFAIAPAALACGPFDLKVDKTGPTQATPGDEIVYEITARDVHAATDTSPWNVVITDVIPQGLTFLPDKTTITTTPGRYPTFPHPIVYGKWGLTPPSCSISGQTLTCRLPYVGSNPDAWLNPKEGWGRVEVATIRAHFKVSDAIACSTITNQASGTARPDNGERDLNPANNTSQVVTTQILGCPSPTPTPSPSPTPTPTPSPTPTPTPTPSPTPSPTPTPKVSPTPTPTPTPSPSPSPTPTPPPTPSPTPSPTPTPKVSPTPTPSPSPSPTPTPSPSPSPSPTPIVSPTPTPTVSPTPTPSPTPQVQGNITITNISNNENNISNHGVGGDGEDINIENKNVNNVETGDVNVNVKTGDQVVKSGGQPSVVHVSGGHGGHVAGTTTTHTIPTGTTVVVGKGGGKGGIPVPITAPTGPGLAALISSIVGGSGLLMVIRRGL